MKITGKVVDVIDNEGLPNASLVFLDGQGKQIGGLKANLNGEYMADVPDLDKAGAKVQVSFSGYTTQTLYPYELNYGVALAPSGNMMAEIFVVAKSVKSSLVKTFVSAIIVVIVYTLLKKLFKIN